MIVDAHVHLPVLESGSTLNDKKTALLDEMRRNHVDRCIVISDSELTSDIGSLDECAELFSSTANVRVVGGISPLIDFDAQLTRLERYISEGKIVGVKVFPGHEGFYLSDRRLDRVYELAAETDTPVLFHSGWDNSVYGSWEEAEKVITRYPGLKLVCCHCFYPDVASCGRLIQYPNMYFDLSSVADDEAILARIEPEIGKLIEQIPDRVLFGSDYGCCSESAHIRFVEALQISENIRKAVLGENAVRLYRLK